MGQHTYMYGTNHGPVGKRKKETNGAWNRGRALGLEHVHQTNKKLYRHGFLGN